MQYEADLKQSLNGGESQEELMRRASVRQREKDHLASPKCKNFMKKLWEVDAKLQNNPEAQMEQAKKLW